MSELSENLSLSKIDLVIEYGNLVSEFQYKETLTEERQREIIDRKKKIIAALDCSPVEAVRVSHALRIMFGKIKTYSAPAVY